MQEEINDSVIFEDQQAIETTAKSAIEIEGSTPYSLLLERLRAALCASEPAIDKAIVRGETLEEVETSFAEAKALVARVRDELRREGVTVSAGAPSRIPRVPVSAFDKIRAGLSRT